MIWGWHMKTWACRRMPTVKKRGAIDAVRAEDKVPPLAAQKLLDLKTCQNTVGNHGIGERTGRIADGAIGAALEVRLDTSRASRSC
jgi:hypothetical protein